MLYHPKWNYHPVGSLEDFISWAQTKPPDEEYYWPDSQVCACRQYLQARGIPGGWCLNTDMRLLNILALGDGTPRSWTFGKLLERALAAREEK